SARPIRTRPLVARLASLCYSLPFPKGDSWEGEAPAEPAFPRWGARPEPRPPPFGTDSWDSWEGEAPAEPAFSRCAARPEPRPPDFATDSEWRSEEGSRTTTPRAHRTSSPRYQG